MGIPHWVRKLVHMLRKCSIVSRIYLKRDRIKVYYINGITYNYVFTDYYYKYRNRLKITELSSHYEPINLGSQFTYNIYDTSLKDYFLVTRKALKRHTPISKEILANRLTQKFLHDPPQWRHTREEAQADLERLKNAKSPHKLATYSYNISTKQSYPGATMVMYYFNPLHMPRRIDKPQSLSDAIKTPKILHRAMRRLVHKAKYDITVNAVYDMVFRMGFGPRIINPLLYTAILGTLDPDRTVYDPTPGCGFKALACSNLNVKYCHDGKLSAEFISDSGVRTGSNAHDIILLDNNFAEQDIKQVIDLGKQYKVAVIFVKHHQLEDALKYLKPNRYFNIYTNPIPRSPPDHIFIYRHKQEPSKTAKIIYKHVL